MRFWRKLRIITIELLVKTSKAKLHYRHEGSEWGKLSTDAKWQGIAWFNGTENQTKQTYSQREKTQVLCTVINLT